MKRRYRPSIGLPCSGCRKDVPFYILEDLPRCDLTNQPLCENCQFYISKTGLQHFQVVETLNPDDRVMTSERFSNFLKERFQDQRVIENESQTWSRPLEMAVNEFVRQYQQIPEHIT